MDGVSFVEDFRTEVFLVEMWSSYSHSLVCDIVFSLDEGRGVILSPLVVFSRKEDDAGSGVVLFIFSSDINGD